MNKIHDSVLKKNMYFLTKKNSQTDCFPYGVIRAFSIKLDFDVRMY